MATRMDRFNPNLPFRSKAEARLREGTTPATTPWSMGIDALRLLHRLSSNPDTAADALKLLHELQVHQVEIDLQNEELAARDQELINELACYRELFESAPAGCLLVDHEGTITMGNRATQELFGIEPVALPGRRVETLVAAQFREPLLELLQSAAQLDTTPTCIAVTIGRNTAPMRLLFMASGKLLKDKVLLNCCRLPDELDSAS